MSAEPAWQTMVVAPSDQPGGESDAQIQANETPPEIRFRPCQTSVSNAVSLIVRLTRNAAQPLCLSGGRLRA